MIICPLKIWNKQNTVTLSFKHSGTSKLIFGGMPWPQKTGATHYHTKLGLPDKGRTIKGLFVCNYWDLEPLDLLNGLAIGCYRPSPGA